MLARAEGVRQPMDKLKRMVCCVIPAYNAGNTICEVVRAASHFVDMVVVVDDACPQGSGRLAQAEFAGNPRVVVLIRERNGGVGAAMKTGIARCIELNATVIVKLDADGQMDPAFIPAMVECFQADPDLAYVKGNRFVHPSVLSKMPRARLFGNAGLTLLVKFASGYWNMLDPTNGFLAFNGRMISQFAWEEFADSYFFECSVLGQLGLRQAPIGELQMPSIYGADQQSSLSIRRVLFEFPPKLLRMFLRRIVLQYFLFDINLGSVYLFFGSILMLAGTAFGIAKWIQTLHTGEPRTTGTVMFAALPIMIGVQMLLNALMYDVQFAPKAVREFGTRAKEAVVVRQRRLG